MTARTAVGQHWPRIAITLLPVLLALIHAAGVYRFPFVEQLDLSIYDVRLRATMPRTLDPRVVIVDIDDPSLQELGQWPWSRNKLAALATELIDRQQAAVLGFDVMFAEPDGSSGLSALRQIASGPLREVPGFKEQVDQLAPELDNDAIFANVLKGRPVALGYYFTQTEQPRGKGWLPSPVFSLDAFPPGQERATSWNGFGGNIAPLADATSHAGFLNVLIDADGDGSVRAAPALAKYDGTAAKAGYYESLGLTMYRMVDGMPPLVVANGDLVLARGGPRWLAVAHSYRRQRQHAGALPRTGRRAWRIVPVCAGSRCAQRQARGRRTQGKNRAGRCNRARPARPALHTCRRSLSWRGSARQHHLCFA